MVGICLRKSSCSGTKGQSSKVTEHSKKSHTPNKTWLREQVGVYPGKEISGVWVKKSRVVQGRAEENSPCGLVKRVLDWMLGTLTSLLSILSSWCKALNASLSYKYGTEGSRPKMESDQQICYWNHRKDSCFILKCWGLGRGGGDALLLFCDYKMDPTSRQVFFFIYTCMHVFKKHLFWASPKDTHFPPVEIDSQGRQVHQQSYTHQGKKNNSMTAGLCSG